MSTWKLQKFWTRGLNYLLGGKWTCHFKVVGTRLIFIPSLDRSLDLSIPVDHFVTMQTVKWQNKFQQDTTKDQRKIYERGEIHKFEDDCYTSIWSNGDLHKMHRKSLLGALSNRQQDVCSSFPKIPIDLKRAVTAKLKFNPAETLLCVKCIECLAFLS